MAVPGFQALQDTFPASSLVTQLATRLFDEPTEPPVASIQNHFPAAMQIALGTVEAE